MQKEYYNGSKDGLEALYKILDNYQHGTAGGHIDDQLDHAQNTIEMIKHYASGGTIEVLRNSYVPFRVYRIHKKYD